LSWHVRFAKWPVLVAIAVVAVAYFLQDDFVRICLMSLKHFVPFAKAPAPNVLTNSGYLRVVSCRLIWWALIGWLVFWIDPESLAQIIALKPGAPREFLGGLAIGVLAMTAIILTTVVVGDAHLTQAPGSSWEHAVFGARWLIAEIVGAAGEELLYRGLIFLLAARLIGAPGAAVVSALVFVLDHGGNPGASAIWMVRLFAASLLLSYSVVRTKALWWAIGYHAGWNFGSAPTFGAAGSGYINQGHILTYIPVGSRLMTGGSVGPEGSILAFFAVLIATCALIITVPSAERTSKRLL
jgi:uncharacterized protein